MITATSNGGSHAIQTIRAALVHIGNSKDFGESIVEASFATDSKLTLTLSRDKSVVPFAIHLPHRRPRFILLACILCISCVFPTPIPQHFPQSYTGFLMASVSLFANLPTHSTMSLFAAYIFSVICRSISQVVFALIVERQQPHPQFHNQGYLPNGSSGPVPGAQALLPNNGRVIQSGATRVLCVADVRGIRVHPRHWAKRQ